MINEPKILACIRADAPRVTGFAYSVSAASAVRARPARRSESLHQAELIRFGVQRVDTSLDIPRRACRTVSRPIPNASVPIDSPSVVGQEVSPVSAFGHRTATKYVYSWGPRFRIPGLRVLDRKGQLCSVLARGAMNSALVEFEDGERHVVSRNALRRARA